VGLMGSGGTFLIEGVGKGFAVCGFGSGGILSPGCVQNG